MAQCPNNQPKRGEEKKRVRGMNFEKKAVTVLFNRLLGLLNDFCCNPISISPPRIPILIERFTWFFPEFVFTG